LGEGGGLQKSNLPQLKMDVLVADIAECTQRKPRSPPLSVVLDVHHGEKDIMPKISDIKRGVAFIITDIVRVRCENTFYKVNKK
jgi:hypothetical protein